MEVKSKARGSVTFGKTTIEKSIVPEWDNSTELGMRRVSGLEYRCCLSKWKTVL